MAVAKQNGDVIPFVKQKDYIMELFKQFQDNPSFKKWLSDLVFNLTYNKDGKPYENPDAASTE